MKLRSLVIAGTAVAAFAVVPAAQAADQAVSVTGVGTSITSLGVVIGTPTVFTSFTPGQTATAPGALLATATDANWQLTVVDSLGGANAGKARSAGGASCTGSDAVAGSSAATVSVTGITGADPAFDGVAKTIGASPVKVAQSDPAGKLPISAVTALTSYSLPIASDALLRFGCTYTLPLTYTIS